jgi:hypothetical protein
VTRADDRADHPLPVGQRLNRHEPLDQKAQEPARQSQASDNDGLPRGVHAPFRPLTASSHPSRLNKARCSRNRPLPGYPEVNRTVSSRVQSFQHACAVLKIAEVVVVCLRQDVTKADDGARHAKLTDRFQTNSARTICKGGVYPARFPPFYLRRSPLARRSSPGGHVCIRALSRAADPVTWVGREVGRTASLRSPVGGP